MLEVILRLAAFVLIFIVAPIVFFSQRQRKRDQRRHEEHVNQLHYLAQRLSGRLSSDPEVTTPRSESLRPAFREAIEGSFVARANSRSIPRYDYAIDFQRRGWQVRVTEASMIKAGPNGSRTVHEHRIDARTGVSPALTISPVLPDTSFRTAGITVTTPDPNQQMFDEEAAQPRGNGQQWRPVQLSVPLNGQLRAFAANAQFAELVFNAPAVEWIVQGNGHLRHLIVLENGVLYAVGKDRIDTDSILATVDVLIGFLDRIPAEAWHSEPGAPAVQEKHSSTPLPASAPTAGSVPLGASARWKVLGWVAPLTLGIVVMLLGLLL